MNGPFNGFQLIETGSDPSSFALTIAKNASNPGNYDFEWRPPFVVEVTDALQSGENRLTVAVTNTWRNRLIGDASLPAEKRVGWSLFRDQWFAPDTPLDPAGLLGPVKLQTARAKSD